MNQLLRKASFVSGLLLLFAPVVFSLVLKFVSYFQHFLNWFDSEQLILYAFILIVSILEVIYFINIFRAYRAHEPHAYFLIYSTGILTTLAVLGSSLFEAYQYLHILKIIFFLVLLFALFSFRYQKENFFAAASSTDAQKNILIVVILTAVIGIASYYISINFFLDSSVFPYFLPAIISLVLVPWWRKKVSNSTLRSAIFLPAFQVVITHLVLQLFSFWNFFQGLKYFYKVL